MPGVLHGIIASSYRAAVATTTELATAHAGSPYVTAWPWTNGAYGTKFTNPNDLPAGTGYEVAFPPAGNYVAVGHATSPYITAYPWSSSGFGTKVSDPGAGNLPTGTGYGVSFSPAGDYLAVSGGLVVYPWTTGFGTKVSDPASLPSITAYANRFSSGGAYFAVAASSSPYINTYPWSGGFGTRISTTGITLPGGGGRGISFSPADDYLAIAHDGAPQVTVYPWSSSGYGTKVNDPSPAIGNQNANGQDVVFSPASDYIFVSGPSPYIHAFPWTGAFGTKVTAPGTTPGSTGWKASITTAGDYLAVSTQNSPYISVYPWTGSYGTRVSTTGVTLPAGSSEGVAFVTH